MTFFKKLKLKKKKKDFNILIPNINASLVKKKNNTIF